MIKGSRHTQESLRKMRRPRTSRRDPLERFWEKVDKRGPDECWPWLGTKTSGNFKYGVFCLDARDHFKRVLAHRFAYRLAFGDAALPDDVCLLHFVCDNPPCCNPRHTGPGTRRDNNLDRDSKHRQALGERNGHVKLTAAEADTLKWSRNVGGVSLAILSRWYGISMSEVSKIARGEAWALPQAS